MEDAARTGLLSRCESFVVTVIPPPPPHSRLDFLLCFIRGGSLKTVGTTGRARFGCCGFHFDVVFLGAVKNNDRGPGTALLPGLATAGREGLVEKAGPAFAFSRNLLQRATFDLPTGGTTGWARYGRGRGGRAGWGAARENGTRTTTGHAWAPLSSSQTATAARGPSLCSLWGQPCGIRGEDGAALPLWVLCRAPPSPRRPQTYALVSFFVSSGVV